MAPAAQYIPPTSSFFYLFYEISVNSPIDFSELFLDGEDIFCEQNNENRLKYKNSNDVVRESLANYLP